MSKSEIKKPILRVPVVAPPAPSSILPGPGAEDAATVSRTRLFGGSCAYFASRLLTGDPAPPYNGRFFVGAHHREWDQLVRDHKRLCVMAPRDHGKTFFFDFAYPLWKSTRVNNNLGYIFSSTQVQASRILEDIKREVENNPALANYRPRSTSGKWSSTRIRLANGSQIVARGFGTRVRGAHPHWIVVDDGLNDETVFSETVRKKQIEYFFTAISNLVTPAGQLIVVGCVSLETWVTTAKGLRRMVDILPGQVDQAALYDINIPMVGRRGIQRAHKYFVQGPKVDTRAITLEFGFNLESSLQHPCLTMPQTGIPDWVPARNLRVGDYVAVYAGAEAWGDPFPITVEQPTRGNKLSFPQVVTEDLAYLIGLWVAEGSFETTGRVMISNTDTPIREWLLTHPFGMRFAANCTHGSEQTLRCSAKHFLDVLAALGMSLGTAETKHVPPAIMGGSRKAAIGFLQGVFDGDGNSFVQENQLQVSLGTVSERLAHEVQLLLLNLGILSCVRKRPPAKPTKKIPQGGRHSLWVVVITGQDAWFFMGKVGFRLPRKQSILQKSDFARFVSRVRGIPNQRRLIAAARREKPRRARGDFLNVPHINISEISGCVRPNRKTLQSVVDWFRKCGSSGNGVKGIEANLEEDHLIWLKVHKIEDRRSHVVDFCIDGDSSFVTNGLVSHNTPFHEQDLYSELQRNPRYHFVRYQAVDEKTGVALWPERYSIQTLKDKKAEIGGIRFAREFQCVPVSDEMSLFPSNLFRGQPTEQAQVTLGMPLDYWRERGVTQVFMGVDFALSSSAAADYTVIWVVGLDDHRNRWVLDIERGKGLDYHVQKSMITKQAIKYQADLIILESNQAQRIFGDDLIRETDLPIKKYETGAEKHALDKGIPSLRLLLENRKFRIPRGDPRSIELTDTWISEMRAFAFDKGKVVSVAAHDDTVMACWLCEQGIALGAFSADFGQAEATLSEEQAQELDAAWYGTDAEQADDAGAADQGKNGGNGKRLAPVVGKPATGNLMDTDEVEAGSKFWSVHGF